MLCSQESSLQLSCCSINWLIDSLKVSGTSWTEIFPKANLIPGGNPDFGGDPAHILGTDQIGRDLLSRLIYGAQNTVGIAFITTCLAFLIGIFFGFLSASLGGWFDQIISRLKYETNKRPWFYLFPSHHLWLHLENVICSNAISFFM